MNDEPRNSKKRMKDKSGRRYNSKKRMKICMRLLIKLNICLIYSQISIYWTDKQIDIH